MSSDCKPDMIEEVRKRFEMLIPEQRAILYSKIPDKRITNYLEEALQKKNVSTAFKKLYDHKDIRLVYMYDILDDILFKEGVKVVAELFYKLNQRQRHSLYVTLGYKEDIRKILNDSTYVNQNKSDKNCFNTILHLSDSGAIELEELYNYLTNPPKSPVNVVAASKRKRSSNSHSPGPTKKRSRHPSPRGFSPVRRINLNKLGPVRPGNKIDKAEEASARKLFFPEGTQTNIRSFLEKPRMNKRGTITIGRVTNNNSNNED
jgi:hypothetical protein